MAHRASQNLIDELRTNPELYKKAGSPSNEYFLWNFYQCQFGFARFLLKNKQLDNQISFSQTEYQKIRFCTILLISADIAFGIIFILYLLL